MSEGAKHSGKELRKPHQVSRVGLAPEQKFTIKQGRICPNLTIRHIIHLSYYILGCVLNLLTSKMSNPPSNQDALAHVCHILELDDQAASFLKANQVRSIRRFDTTTVDKYQELANLPNSPINTTDIDQINLFRIWYTNVVQKQKTQPSNQDLIDGLLEKEWDDFCNQYLVYI